VANRDVERRLLKAENLLDRPSHDARVGVGQLAHNSLDEWRERKPFRLADPADQALEWGERCDVDQPPQFAGNTNTPREPPRGTNGAQEQTRTGVDVPRELGSDDATKRDPAD